MNFTAPAALLARAADLAKRCSAKYAPLDRVLLTPGPQLTITSSAGLLSLRQTIDVPAHGPAVLVPADDFARCAKLFSGEVVAKIDEKKARFTLAAKPRRSEIQYTSDTSGAPKMPTHDGETREVYANALRVAIERVKHAATTDAALSHMHGVRAEFIGDGVRAVAASNRGLTAHGALAGDPEAHVFLPMQSLPLLSELLPDSGSVRVARSEGRAFFEGAGWLLSIAAPAGEYPAWRAYIPEARKARILVDAKALASELAVTLAGAEDKGDTSGRVHIALDAGTLRIRGESTEREAETELAVDSEPAGLRAKFSIAAPILLGALGALPPGDCSIGVDTELAPITVEPADKSSLSVLMPMRAE